MFEGEFAFCFEKNLSSIIKSIRYLLKVDRNYVTDTNLSLNDALRLVSTVISIECQNARIIYDSRSEVSEVSHNYKYPFLQYKQFSELFF